MKIWNFIFPIYVSGKASIEKQSSTSLKPSELTWQTDLKGEEDWPMAS